MKKYYVVFLVLLAVPSLASASIDTNLSYGSKGASVIELQEFLISHNFLTGQATGNFYSLTKSAVIAYQKSVGVSPTGFVGMLTRAQINSVSEAKNNSVVPPKTDTSSALLQQQNDLLQKQLAEQQKLVQIQTQQNQQLQQSLGQIVSNTTPPVVQPAIVLQPTTISIQNSVVNLTNTNFKTEYQLSDLLANGNTDGRIWMDAYILDQNGQNYYNTNPDAVMTITTSDHSNDKVLKGSGDSSAQGYYYQYTFYATRTGTYTINFSVLGLTKSVTISVN